MTIYSRRQFLKNIGALTAFCLANQSVFSFAQNTENFEMLVVGDSLIWGQGLEEKDKFYTLVKNWLQSQLNKEVSMKVKAHSGATLFLHEKEEKLMKKGDLAETTTFHPEVALSFPTLKTQIDTAKNEYQNSEKVDLILLTGGLVDITVAGILNPLGNNKILQDDIKKYCNDDMFRFLEYSANVFPNALFAVVGYFPILSPKTSTSKMLNSFLEAYSFPRPLKPLANNILARQIFRPVQKKALKRSRIWYQESNLALETAVNRLNEKLGKQRAIFIKAPLTEDNALDTPQTLLFTMGKRGRTEDFVYDKRVEECRKTYPPLKKQIGLDLIVRQCEIAGIGHPNIAGSKAYADAIIEKLKLNLSVK